MTRTSNMTNAFLRSGGLFLLLFTIAGHASSQTTIPAPGFQPSGLAYDGTFLYVSELSGIRKIFRLDPTTGAALDFFLAPGAHPNDIVFDGVDRLFISDIGGTVYEIDTTGMQINSFQLYFRGGAIAFDGTNLYIGDFDGSRIRVTDRFGAHIRTFDSGLRPAGMVFDPATGNLWVISEFDEIISEITTEGVLVRECDGPRNPGVQGLGAVTLVGSSLYIAEVSDPDPFTEPEIPGTIFIVDSRTLPCEPALLFTVAIDIKPQSCPNPLNVKSGGVLPVAILGSADFDLTQIDLTTIRLEGVPPLRCAVADVATPFGGTFEGNCMDCTAEGADGFFDAVLLFSIQDVVQALGDVQDGECRVVILTGELLDGTSIRGEDVVRILK